MEDARVLVEEEELPFRVLSARGIPVLADYGLEHPDGFEGETIAVPAEILVRGDGTIAWSHVARRITERAAPEEVLEAIAGL